MQKTTYPYKDELSAFSYKKVTKLKPNHTGAWFEQGIILERLDKYEEALECYIGLINLKPSSGRAWFAKGRTLESLSCYSEAIDAYQEAAKLRYRVAEAKFRIGIILEERGDFADAKAELISISGVEPKFKPAIQKLEEIKDKEAMEWIILGDSFFDKRQYTDALSTYEEALQIQPSHKLALSKKQRTIQKLDSLKNDKARKYVKLGNKFFDSKDYAEALSHYEQALKIQPTYKRALERKEETIRKLNRQKNKGWFSWW